MAPEMEPQDNYDIQDLQHSLRTTKLELNLERSRHSVEIVSKDEEIRKLRFQQLVLEDEKDALHDQLSEEEARSDGLEQSLDEALAQLEQLQMENQSFQNDLRTQAREAANLKAEIKAMENITTDSNKLLSEKLALTREMASLKPEVEHLRAQVDANQGLLTDKLSLQRQLNTIQVELENDKRVSAKAAARQGRKREQDEEVMVELEGLRKELAKEKCDREKAQEKAAKKDVDKAGKADAQNELVDEIRQELQQEKRDRQKAEKASQKTVSEIEGKNAVLEEKLSQFRTKLRTTKDKLKETEAELETVKASATIRPSIEATGKNPRKRMAASVDPDAMMGTPGDVVKRKKRAASVAVATVGDKSTFSITPFLNRTTNVSADSPDEANDKSVEDKDEGEDPEATPTAAPKIKKAEKKASQAKLKPLAPSSSSKANAKPAPRKKTVVPTLEKVTEETSEINDEDSENAAPAAPTTTKDTTTASAPTDEPTKPLPKLKSTSLPKGGARKSLMSFAAFTTEPEPEKKKKRKLGSSTSSFVGKTLFDVEEDAAPAKPIPGKGLFANRAIGKSVLGKGGAAPIKGGFMMTTADGFQFSPLKKERKGQSVLK